MQSELLAASLNKQNNKREVKTERKKIGERRE
jgi:hypothetical protein